MKIVYLKCFKNIIISNRININNVLFGFYLKILTIDESKNSLNSQPRLPFLKPKPLTGSAFCPVISKPLKVDSSKHPKTCNQVVCDTLNQCKQTLCATISTQILIESTKEKSQSPTPKYDDLKTITTEVPHEIRSLLPLNSNVRAISPAHLVVFPPEIPSEYRNHYRSKTSTPKSQHEINNETMSVSTTSFANNQIKSVMYQHTAEVPHRISSPSPKSYDIKVISPTHLENFPSPEYKIANRSKSPTPQPEFETYIETEPEYEISFDANQVESTISHCSVECTEVIEQKCIKQYDNYEKSSSKTFNTIRGKSVPCTSSANSKLPMFVTDENRAESPMVTALKTAPDRSYSPLPTFVDAHEFIPKPSENTVEKEQPMTMADALAIAPERSYKLPESNTSTRPIGNNPVRYMHGYNKKIPEAPLLMTRTLFYSPASAIDSEEEQIAILGLKSFPPVSDELKWSTAAGDFDRNEPNFDYVEELVFDTPEIEKLEESVKEKVIAEEPTKPLSKHPFTATGLHEPSDIPRYQQSIPENPHRATPKDKISETLIGPGIKDRVSTFTPKSCIKNASFLKQESNVHSKVAPTLGYEPSYLEGGRPSKVKYSVDPIAVELSNLKPVSSNAMFIGSTSALPSSKESIPSTPKPSLSDDTLVEPVTPMPRSSLPAALLSKKLTCLTKKQQPKFIPTPTPIPDLGGQQTGRTGASAGLTAPRRGRGILNPQNLTPGARVPLCGQCNLYIRGPFITALGKIWCPEHFVCTNEKCKRPLQDIGFVEEDNGLYCEYCFEQYLAPICSKCSKKIKADCLNAIGKQFHPECFNCTYCGKLFGNSPFFLEDSLPYCENDWNELFTTKCISCGFPIEAGDRWVEALNNNYHSPCFNCSKCKVNLEGQSFFAKGGKPYCKSHAR